MVEGVRVTKDTHYRSRLNDIIKVKDWLENRTSSYGNSNDARIAQRLGCSC
jgi:hypothetical protein